mgnify:CR=1 FL=1
MAVAPEVETLAVPKSPIPTGFSSALLVYAVSVSPEEKLLLVVICTLSTVFPVDTKVVFEVIGPRTRPVAMNPVDHPMGGGEGKASGGHPRSKKGIPAKGFRTRSKKKSSSKFIIERRKK